MYKKIFGLCFIAVFACTFSMEKMLIILREVRNDSKEDYVIVYGLDGQDKVSKDQEIDINYTLFNVVPNQHFPEEKKIIIKDVSLDSKVRFFNVKMPSYLVFAIGNCATNRYGLETNKRYNLDLIIDENGCVRYRFEQNKE